MFDITMTFLWESKSNQERSGDEYLFQVAAISIIDEVVNVDIHNLDGSDGLYLGGSVVRRTVATISTTNPYFGFVIRALELDNSSRSNREADETDFQQSITQQAQLVVDSGGLPNVDILWLSGNEPQLRDRIFVDDDDIIGVSARSYPNYGWELDVLTRHFPSSDLPGRRVRYSWQGTQLAFFRDGGGYRLNVGVEGRYPS